MTHRHENTNVEYVACVHSKKELKQKVLFTIVTLLSSFIYGSVTAVLAFVLKTFDE
jgi:hypothetical protein